MVGVSEGSCFTLHSNTTDLPRWTTLYSGCFRIRVGSDGRGDKGVRASSDKLKLKHQNNETQQTGHNILNKVYQNCDKNVFIDENN